MGASAPQRTLDAGPGPGFGPGFGFGFGFGDGDGDGFDTPGATAWGVPGVDIALPAEALLARSRSRRTGGTPGSSLATAAGGGSGCRYSQAKNAMFTSNRDRNNTLTTDPPQ